jgi:uncharacterized membrane protein
MKYMEIIEICEANKNKILSWAPLGIIVFLLAGCVMFPRVFYDNFIWKYFWGPIVSDAVGHTVSLNGAEAAEKFTWVSEIVYGLMVLIVLYWLYKLIKRWDISVDWHVFIALLPYIILGIVTRVLEDSSFFVEPWVYWFITPLIYIQIVLWVLVFLVLGHYLEVHWKHRYLTLPNVMFIGGIILLTPFLFFIGQRFISDGAKIDVFLLISALVFLIVICVYAFSRFFKSNDKIAVFSQPLNLAMIMGHMLDGFASYISIYNPLNMDIIRYTEKHPVLLIILVIYVFDVLYKEELKDHRQFVNILKIVIFILGFAPGLRDLLRVMMGV